MDPIYQYQIEQYRNDSTRALADRRAFRRRLVRASIRGHLSAILNRLTLCNSTTSILATVGASALVAHSAFA